MKSMIRLSIVIVNYNTGGLLYRCLDSIRRNITLDYEVIVADNASTDESLRLCEEFWTEDRFRLLKLDANYGFAKANNMAAAISSAPLIHFLNPDTELSAGMNEDYKEALQHPDAVYVNPLRNPDGTLENAPKPVPNVRNIFLWQFCRSKAQIWYKGASVIISREVFLRIGRWSEEYFMYSEDLDLFYSLQKSGVEIRMLPCEIFHHGGGSSSRAWDNLQREIVVQRSTRIFFKKYFSDFQYFTHKLYYLFHYLLKNPSRVPMDVKAWRLSAGK